MNETLDLAVIGGSYAGMSAALQVVRARRRVAVDDAGQRRNRFAAASHGFLGQDGRAPGAIIEEAKAQLLAYPTLQWIDARVLAAKRIDDERFELALEGRTLRARRLVLASGVVDELPAIDGLAQRWGKSVFHCPYCHGYELQQGRIGVLAGSPLSMHHALMLPDWGSVTLFLNGAFEPDAEQQQALRSRGVAVESARVKRISGTATVELADGRQVECDGLFTLSRTHLPDSLAEQLGCRLEQTPTGSYIARDELLQTSVPGVFACGDAARSFGNVAISVGDGALAGAMAHRSLVFGL
ncbi:NAD(P)/FAD-dependent oxidoreductase [Variovorax sp. LARHSF232]